MVASYLSLSSNFIQGQQATKRASTSKTSYNSHEMNNWASPKTESVRSNSPKSKSKYYTWKERVQNKDNRMIRITTARHRGGGHKHLCSKIYFRHNHNHSVRDWMPYSIELRVEYCTRDCIYIGRVWVLYKKSMYSTSKCSKIVQWA